MNVLMISLDEGLLGQTQVGDVIERHREYGRQINRLDIIVFSENKNTLKNRISGNVCAYSTNSFGIPKTVREAVRIGKNLSRKRRYDLIVSQDPLFTGLAGFFLRNRLKAKLLVHLHGDFVDNSFWLKGDWRNYLFALVLGFIIRRADGIRVMSQHQKDKLENRGIDDKRIQVISTPVDLDRFETSSKEVLSKKTGGHIPWSKVVLMVGRKDKVKDFDTLFSAMRIVFNRIEDVGLWLVGNFVDNKDVPLPVNRVLLSGNLATDKLPACYRAADVVVLSSTSESFGKVLIEANVCGKPVVATATTGAKEIIRHGENGFIVPIKDHKCLAKKIIYLLDHPEEAKRIGENGRKIVKEKYFDNTKKIISYWNELGSG